MARRYLRDNLRFRLDARALEGLSAYYREAAALELVGGVPPIAFFEEPAARIPA